MKVKFISRENNDAKFSMEFTAEEFENAQIKAYQNTKDKFEIDGFRKGKAPRSIIEKKYGEGIFFEDAIDVLFQENYGNALDELKLDVVDRPNAEFGKIEKGKGFTVTLTVACYPVVEVKDYKEVETTKIEAKASASDVNKEVEGMQKRNARRIVVSRPAKKGDTVLFDYSGFVGDKQFEGGTAEKQKLTLGSGMFIPGFEDQLIGVSANEKKDVVVTFPEEYHAEDLAGKEAVFHCLVHEVEEEQLPALDDEFAKDVSEFDTLDELKKDIKAKLTANAKVASENQMKDAVIAKIYEANKEFTVPEAMVLDEIDRMAQEINQQLSYQGMTLEQYLKMMQTDFKGFSEQMRPDAEKSVKTRIILSSIATQEKIEATDDEANAEIKKMAEMYKIPEEQIKQMIGDVELLKKDLVVGKTIDFVFKQAKLTEVEKKSKTTAKKEETK